MVSLFESADDKRDKVLALAGLLAGIHSLRILAERGLASPQDIAVAATGIRSVLANLPANSMDAAQMAQLDAMLDQLPVAAAQATPRY